MTEAVVTADGWLTMEGQRLRVVLGRGGVRVHKEEGDGATPAGLLPLRRVLFRADRLSPPRCAVPREPLAPDDGWCDEPYDAAYNQQVRLPYSARHEALWRSDSLYDVIGVLGWNDAPVARNQGSAIFLHICHADFAPTDGCIALPLPDLRRLLADGLTAIRVLPD